MRRPEDRRWARAAKDGFWIALAVTLLVGFCFAFVAPAFDPARMGGLDIFATVFTYWFAMGAVRRTSWAQRRHYMKVQERS